MANRGNDNAGGPAGDGLDIAVRRLDGFDPDLALPDPATAGAAGADLRLNLPGRDQVVLAPGARALLPTGLALALPEGVEGQIRPRSGLALRHGVTVLNAPGTIDADYRGHVQVLLVNLGQEPVTLHHGDRIAQLVLAPVLRGRLRPVAVLAGTARGAAGFGSTGRG